jgi:hypothetical protein
MSFQAASRELGRDKQFTSMILIGGFDVDPNDPRKGVDLGGRRIIKKEKSVLVLGNLNVAGLLSSNFAGNLLTEKIQESELTQGVQICGNLVMIDDSTLIGNVCVPIGGSIKTPKLEEKVSGSGISICSDLTASGDIRIVNDGDLYLTPTGLVIIGNTAESIDLSQQVFSNVISVQAATGNPLQLQTDPGFKVQVSAGDGLDLLGRSLCNVGNSDFTGTVTLNGELDMMCTDISNVSQVYVDTIRPKNSNVNVSGNLVTTNNITASLQIFSNNASAILGGLGVGMLYRTGGDPDLVCIVH